MQKDDTVYLGQMLDMARTDFSDDDLRTHLQKPAKAKQKPKGGKKK